MLVIEDYSGLSNGSNADIVRERRGRRSCLISGKFISRSVTAIDTGSSGVRYADDRIGYDSIKYVLTSGHFEY